MTFVVTLGQSTNGRVFNKSVATLCAVWNPSYIKMHATMSNYIKRQKVRWISTTFKMSAKSTALYFMSLVACNLLHEIERRYYDGTTFLRIIAFGKPTNGTVFNKSVSDIVCGVESVVHQDARYKKCRSVFN